MKTFEEFLQEKHGENYIGIDDDMPDDFDRWIENLDPQELIDYANMYGQQVHQSGRQEMAKYIADKGAQNNNTLV